MKRQVLQGLRQGAVFGALLVSVPVLPPVFPLPSWFEGEVIPIDLAWQAIQAPPDFQAQAQQYRTKWAQCEEKYGEQAKALAEAQPYYVQAIAGTITDTAQTRLLAIQQTEDRVLALVAKENETKGLTLEVDPKTKRITGRILEKPKHGKGGQ